MIRIIKRQKIGLKFKEETSDMLHLEHSYCWKRKENIHWMDHMKVLQRVKEERNILHVIVRRNKWIDHILCSNWLLEYIIEGQIEVTIR